MALNRWISLAAAIYLMLCAGVIFVAFLTGSGKYWKNTHDPWWIQTVYIRDGLYTWTGYFLQMSSNVFLGALYVYAFTPESTAVLATLALTFPTALANFAENTTILIDILAAWKE